MSARRLSLRLGPAALTLLLALAVVSGFRLRGSEFDLRPETRNPHPATPYLESAAPTNCPVLLALSEEAAGLTGMLALVEDRERPAQAAAAARRVRGLAAQAAVLEGGEEWAVALSDLAEGLEGYARGDPAALGQVRQASARNAGLRAGCGEG